jgi:ferrochelatase
VHGVLKGVLLLAHGTPDSLEDMPEYLTRVRGGRLPSPELVEEMRHNYASIGGRSPLTDLTRAQAAALSGELGGRRVYVGMRNWTPFIADTLRQAAADGVRELVALPLAPQYSSLSVGKYREAVERDAPEGLQIRFVAAWHDHPGLLDAFAEKVRAGLSSGPRLVVFTAHSLPARVIAEGDPYADHVRGTALGIAARVGLTDYEIAYQSAGRTPEPWLGPSLEELFHDLAARGERRVLVEPVSFVCDHTEILYDLDIVARRQALERGIDFARAESLNTSPTFIRALAAIVGSA